MASTKRKTTARKTSSNTEAQTEKLRKFVDDLTQRLAAIEYLAKYVLEKQLSTLSPEDAGNMG